MWDNVKLLNLAANTLFALVALIVAWAGLKVVLESAAFPLRSIRVEGELTHVVRADVVGALQGRLSGTFFNMDLDAVRAQFETIPWVRRAEVRRLWPDRLEVRLEEHVALARWGQADDGRLVNTHGEVFNGRTDASLPLFAGPAGTEKELTQRYATFRSLLGPLSLEPRAVVLSPRYSWQLRLSNGLAVQLGRDADKDKVADRLARFVGIYPRTLAPLSRRLDYVDLRYSNGFALRVPGLPDTDKAQHGKAAAAQAADKSLKNTVQSAARRKPGTKTPDATKPPDASQGGKST